LFKEDQLSLIEIEQYSLDKGLFVLSLQLFKLAGNAHNTLIP